MTPDDKTVIHVTLPRELYDQLEQYRRDEYRRSVSNAIVFIVRQWFRGRAATEPTPR